MNKLAPLPLNDPLNEFATTLPLTSIEPVNSEPLFADVTTNPLSESTDAVTEPVAILNASSVNADNGILNSPLPSPLNKDADMFPLTFNEPVTSTEPVNCCLSLNSSPNMFEPDE